jgi:tetratricopeptide (TPR) repeat protein
MTSALIPILRHLRDRSASLVHLRAGSTPEFWKGNERLADQGGFEPQTADQLKRMVAVPLADEQLAEYRRRNFIALPLAIKDLGELHLEISTPDGEPEIVIHGTAQPDRDLLFRDHLDLLAEAKESPDDGDVLWNLAMAYLEDGEHQLAWHALERALSLSPDDPTIHYEIGRVLGHHLRRVDEAIAAYERAIASPEAAVEAYVELAVVQRSSQRLPEAEAAVRRGLQAFADHPRLLEALGVILGELERHAEAVEVLERSLALHGPDPEILELLALSRAAVARR